jgi:4-hydroxybenzoate polyprenyltransferase
MPPHGLRGILLADPRGVVTGLHHHLYVIGLYFLINMAYSKWLKHIPIIDVLIISAGFVLRVHAGVTLIQVERFSPWLYVVMTLLSLFLGFGKRRAELALLAHGAGSHAKFWMVTPCPFLINTS